MTELSDLEINSKSKVPVVADKEDDVPEGRDVPLMHSVPEAAKSALGAFELPTGYLDDNGVLHKEMTVREITGVEEDILASKKMPVFHRMHKILENCILNIGSYRQGTAEWPDVVKGLVATDRLFALTKIRIVTLGAAYSFKVQCPDDGCGKFSKQTVSLEDFAIKGMRDPKVRTWSGTLPRSKWSYTARIQTGREEERLAKISRESSDLLSLAIMARLTELNNQQPVHLSMLKGLSLADRNFLRKDFSDHEGEMESTVDMSCPHCGHDFKGEIEMGDPSFFFPSEA